MCSARVREFGLCVIVLSAIAAASASAQMLQIDPEHPRWFLFGAKHVALCGNGIWVLIPNAAMAVAEHNEFAVRWGANSNRTSLFSFCHEAGLCPWMRTGPGNANDGKPKFDLERFNDDYWKRAAQYFEDCRKRGIFPWVQIWDECYVEGGPNYEMRWNMNPFNPDNNVNSIEDLPRGNAKADRDDRFYNTRNARLMEYQDRFVRKALDEFARFPIIWDLGNEVGLDSRLSDDWMRHWVEFFDAYEAAHPGVRILCTVDCNVDNGHYDRIREFDVVNVHGVHGRHASDPFHLEADPVKSPDDSRVDVKKLQANLEHLFARYGKPLANSRITSDPDRKRDLRDRPANALETRHILWGYFLSAAHFISFRNEEEVSWTQEPMTTEHQQVHLRKFIDSFEFWKCVPRLKDIVEAPDAVVLAEARRQYAFYAPNGRHFGNQFDANLAEAEGRTFRARWFDPRTGKFGEPFAVTAGPKVRFALPTDQDWALLLDVPGDGGGTGSNHEPIKSLGVSDNGRRFIINGKAAFLAGFREGYVGGAWNNVYWNHTSPTGLPADHPVSPGAREVDYERYAALIAENGMNLVRCNLIHMAAGDKRVHGHNERPDAPEHPPLSPITERPWARVGPGKAWDGLPKYDLNKWDDRYWSRLADWVRIANEHGIIVEVCLFQQHNYYQIFTHYADNPFRPVNCINDTGLPDAFGATAYPAFYGDKPELRRIQQAFVDKVLDTVGRFPGVIYRVADEYNWTDDWLEIWAERINAWGQAHGRELVVQVGGSLKQMKLMDGRVHSMDGTFVFRRPDGEACDPPSLVEVRLPGYCASKKFVDDAATVHATLLWLWSELPGKALVREGEREPAREAFWAALAGGAAGYYHHGAFDKGFTPEAVRATVSMVSKLHDFALMEPHDDYVARGSAFVLAAPGVECLAYFPRGGAADIKLDVSGGKPVAHWFDPRAGKLSDAGELTGGGPHTFTAPDDRDWVLWIHPAEAETR